MSSIKDIQFSNPMPVDLAKKLGRNGVIEILSAMWLGYEDLKRDNIVTVAMQENTITEEWGIRLSKRWYSENRASRMRVNLTPVTQKEDATMACQRGSPPTIDFCFREWDIRDSYFGVECKNLYDKSNPHVKRYIEIGVKYYISGRYGSKSTVSAMVGYVLSGKVVAIADELKTAIGATKPQLNLNRDISSTDAQYKSQHKRTLDNEVIMLYHLLFDFTA